MEWHELGPAAEPKFGRRSQRIICGGCDTERNSLGRGNSLSLSSAADADRAKAAVAAELRLTRSQQIQRVVSFGRYGRAAILPCGCGDTATVAAAQVGPVRYLQSALETLKSQGLRFP